MRGGCLVMLAVLAASPCLGDTPARPRYRISAVVSSQQPQIRGLVEIDFVNRTATALNEVVLLLFPNRFALPDSVVDDVNRTYVYPYEEFEPGWMATPEVRIDGSLAKVTPRAAPNLPDGCALSIALPRPLPSSAGVTIAVQFETFVPTRFGSFGRFEGMLTAIGGWYPYLATVNVDGTWALEAPPALADFDVVLDQGEGQDLFVNGKPVTSGEPVEVVAVHYLSLIALPSLERDAVKVGSTDLVWLRRPPVRTDRRALGPTTREIMLAALRDILEHAPAGTPAAPPELVVAGAPLRRNLSALGEGMVVISDRALKAHDLLRPFHQRQLAQAVYAELLRPQLALRETSTDFDWVSEGLSYELARRYLASTQPELRSVQDWIELFNIFAIVDRFEMVPKIPFVEAFFERARSIDPLHEQITTFNNDLPPGHVILGKLRQLIGDERFRVFLEQCTAAAEPLRQCAARVAGRDLEAFFTQWLQPYPDINYDVESAHLNQPAGDGYRHTAVVRRQSSRAISEPVDVELRRLGGDAVDLRWDGNGDRGELTTTTPKRMHQLLVDPQHQLLETTRADNAVPFDPQIVLDSAEVEISSTEFGFSGLLVGRNRSDYHKDIAAVGTFTNRGIGADFGPRYHWGKPNDPTLFRHNLFAFYGVQALDRDFTDERDPSRVTSGHVNGLGLRYNYNTLVAFDNPSDAIDLRLYGDWNDPALGSSYAYTDWGGSAAITHWLWTPRTVLAGQVLNGFSEPLGSSRVPNQGLYSLGGSRSIRGIGAEEQLGRNIFLLRGEIRQSIYPEVDLNFLDLLVMRRSQVRVFVDSGQVSNSAGRIYDPSGYAVGVGVGFSVFYEFMGFFPAVAYIELATRADRDPGDIQFLFGTRQAF